MAATQRSPTSNRAIVLTWLWASISAFACSLSAAVFFVLSTPRIQASLFYVVLVGLGLCSAGFLFGALRSRANYVGSVHGRLQISGPAVVFLIVILLGLKLAKPAESERLAVYLKGPNGLLNDGIVNIRIGAYSQSTRLGPRQSADFDIPAEYLGKPLQVDSSVPDYDPVTDQLSTIPADHAVYLTLKCSRSPCVAH